MFGLNFLLQGEERKEEEEDEDEGRSQFFTFPPTESKHRNGSQEKSSFPLNFNLNGCDRDSRLESNETTATVSANSSASVAFCLFEKKSEEIVDQASIMMEERDVDMELKTETESFPSDRQNTKPESDVRPQKLDCENHNKDSFPAKTSKPFSPWKTPFRNNTMMATAAAPPEEGGRSELVDGSSDEPMHQLGATMSNGIAESATASGVPGPSRYPVTPKSKILEQSNGYDKERCMERGEGHGISTTRELNDVSSVAPCKSVRRNLFAGVTPKKCHERNDPSIAVKEKERNLDSEISGNPSEFVSFLRNRFGSTEEFGQFEQYFYGQVEEVRMLRGNVEGLRSALVKTQEGKRVLELQLVSEKALRDQESKNALTDLEKNNMQLNTQIYSMKCEVETWKRKAEATLKESGWLKQQLKSLELEKTEAVRKVSEITRQHNGFEQYRISIEAYARRQREAMTDIQKKLLELEKAKETLESLTDHNQKQMNFMAVHLKNRENHRFITEKRVGALEEELINARAELVQNNAKLVRVQTCENKRTDLMGKLIIENKDLHCGINLLVSTMHNNLGETNIHFLDRIEKIHEEVEESVKELQIFDSCP